MFGKCVASVAGSSFLLAEVFCGSMNTMDAIFTHLQELLVGAWAKASERFSDIVPEAFLAIFVVLIGWLIASLLQMLSLRILKFFAIDKLAGKTPLERLLKDIGIRKGLADIFSYLVFWLAILFTLTIASDMLQLQHVSLALAVVTSYIPQAIAALLIIVFGMLLARFLQVLTTQALKRANVVGDKIAGRLVNIIVVIFVAFAAVEQLGIGLDFVTTNAIIGIATSLILLGLALIIGGRSLIEGWIITQYLHHEIRVGDTVEIDGKHGTIVRISPVAIILKIGDHETAIPSKQFVDHGYTRFSSAG